MRTMKIKVEAKKENLHQIMSFCNNFIISQCSPDYSSNLLLVAVEEVFTNIASYAFPEEVGYAELELLLINENIIKVTFSDNGCPFNPIEFESDVRAKDNIKSLIPGGLGLYIVKNTMKNLKYEYIGGCNIFSFETAVEEKDE